MPSKLYSKVNYISGLKFLFSSYIREYDLSKANISVLRKYNVIDDNLYHNLYKAPRQQRQVTVGLMEQTDKNVTKIKKQGIEEAKKMLFESNNIEDADILSIKNDAIFTINKPLNITKFGYYIDFKLKNVFTSYVYLNRIEVYYGRDVVTGQENIQTKGLGENAHLHDNFMTDFIVYIMNELGSGDIVSAVSSFSDFYDDYINYRLNVEYYREYNPLSKFSILNTPYKVSYIDQEKYDIRKTININYNMNILRELYGYITSKYFTDMHF